MDGAVDTAVYMPVCLPPTEADYVGKTGKLSGVDFSAQKSIPPLAWVTGWGKISENGVQATILQEIELKVVNDQTCYDVMTGELGIFWG